MGINTHQPMPVRKEDATAVWPLVWEDLKEGLPANKALVDILIADCQERDAIGWERYGGPLVTNDGRDTLVDLYQEVLDSVVYAKKGLLEGRGDPGVYVALIALAAHTRALILEEAKHG